MSTKNSLTPTKKYKLILSAVHLVYRLVNSVFNMKELVLRLTRLLCQFIKASSCSIYILDDERKKPKLKAIFNNQINIYVTKKKELQDVSEMEERALQGYTVFEKNILGVPLVADDIVGAIIIHRQENEPPFTEFDKEMLCVVAEQSVTAIKNLQLYEQQQGVILESIKLIGKFLEQQGRKQRKNVSAYFKIVQMLGEKLNVSQDGIDNLYYASILRDAGLIDVPYEILAKRSQLTPGEFKEIRSQPAKSVELIKPVAFLRPVLPILLYHHEKYDGTGYPSGLKKQQIPLGARIMAVVNAFEAMTSERPYKKQLTFDEALQELKDFSGTQFDPRIVKVFLTLCRQKKFRNYLSIIT